MRITEKELKILENNDVFVTELDNEYELEAWTTAGVDMLIYIDKDIKADLVSQLKEYARYFDIDSEIDLYRESADYRNAFTIRDSLDDFENWIKFINSLIHDLEEELKC